MGIEERPNLRRSAAKGGGGGGQEGVIEECQSRQRSTDGDCGVLSQQRSAEKGEGGYAVRNPIQERQLLWG